MSDGKDYQRVYDAVMGDNHDRTQRLRLHDGTFPTGPASVVAGEPVALDGPTRLYSQPHFDAAAAKAVIRSMLAFDLWYACSPVTPEGQADRNNAMRSWLGGAKSLAAMGVVEEENMRAAFIAAFEAAGDAFK